MRLDQANIIYYHKLEMCTVHLLAKSNFDNKEKYLDEIFLW